MKDMFVPVAEVGTRLRSGCFWLRCSAGIGLGHVYGAIGFAAVVALLTMASEPGPLSMEGASLADGIARLPWKVSLGTATGLKLVPIVVAFMAPLTLLGAPVPIAAAAALKTGRAATMTMGAAAGLLVGWPLSIVVYGFHTMGDVDCALGAVATGAMFGLGLWQICIRRYLS